MVFPGQRTISDLLMKISRCGQRVGRGPRSVSRWRVPRSTDGGAAAQPAGGRARWWWAALLLMLTPLAAGPAVFAQTFSQEPPAFSMTFTPSVVSQYMFRGVRLGGPAIQPAVEGVRGRLALGLWTSFPLADKVPGVSDPELDVYGTYAIPLGDGSMSVVPGFTWYYYPRADRAAGRHSATFEPSLAVNAVVAGVRLTPKVYYDTVLDGPTAELSAAFAVLLKRLGTELDFSATLGTYRWRDVAETSGGRTKSWGDYWQCGVAVPYAVARNARLTAGVAYAQGRHQYTKEETAPKRANAAAVGRVVVTLSYALSF